MLIGLSGFAGSGKSEVARVLIEEFGLVRIKFADPLKNMYRAMLRDMGHTAEDIERYVEGDLKRSVIDGLEGLGVTSRGFMIDLGTAFGRKILHPDFWVHLWNARVQATRADVVADDLRFVNEEREVRANGGVTIQIRRPGAAPAAFKWKRLGPWLYRRFGIMWGVHDSERIDRLKPDFVIINSGSLASLRADVRHLAESLQL